MYLIIYFVVENKLFIINTFARFVDFPTPLTPQKAITYGLSFFLAIIASRKISILRFGDNICTRDSIIVFFTVDATDSNEPRTYTKYIIKITVIFLLLHYY